MRKPLVVISGATATGKSALAVNIAKIIGGEIISADSMQIYKHMNIGTAKITKEEMQGIPHHLIDIIEPDASFDANEFKNRATEVINEIYERGSIPIIAGGTGFYIQAVTRDIDFTEENDNSVREQITEFYSANGEDALFERLRGVDPESCLIIPKQNVKRVIRAIEFFELHHKKISEHNLEQKEKKSPYNLAYFVINDDRQKLYQKIDARVDVMIKDGLLDEVENLLANYNYSSSSGLFNAIGYKEIIEYKNGDYSLDRAIELIKQNSRHYAKRQITFFKREKDAVFIDKTKMNNDEAVKFILDVLKEKEII